MGAYRFYRSYLDAAHQAHTWIKEIWIMFKMTLSIKTKLLLVLPTDHGDVSKWTSHGNKFEGSSEYILQLWDQKLKVREK
jgi:hypothetical protein